WFWKGDYEGGSADLGYRELYLRWLQMATFIPVMRSHGRCTPREPWRFGDVGEPVYDAIAASMRLRYRLLPYLYSLAGWTTQRGYTPMRMLAFDFRDDPEVFDIVDQFMLGPSLLIAPVTEPMLHGPDSTPLTDVPQSRTVYLPAGVDWFDFWTGERYRGGQRIAAAAPLDRIPVFVRAGTILPLGPQVQHTEEDPWGPLELRIYPGADASFDLYEDAGDGYGYEVGEFAFVPIRWDDDAQTLTVQPREGDFAAVPAQRSLHPVVVSPSTSAISAPSDVSDAAISYDGTGDRWSATPA
ncbi:MAG: DUF5110 domain-containing protein, partial [Allobranchiibius sp.]